MTSQSKSSLTSKRSIVATLAFVCSFVSANQMLAQLTPAPTSAIRGPIFSMHLLSASTGWIRKGNHLLVTRTLGKSWDDITPPLAPTQTIAGVFFLNDLDHAWLCTESADSEGTELFGVVSTSDGGKSWSATSVVPDEAPLEYTGGQLDFVDAYHGWLLLRVQGGTASSRSKLFSSRDGGQVWQPLPLPPINGTIHFFADGTGWIAGGVHQDELYRTLDAGRTWSRVILALPKDVQPYSVPDGSASGIYHTHPQYQGPHFSDELHGIMLVSVPVSEAQQIHLIYETEDGGNTWDVQKTVSPMGWGYVTPPSFFDSSFLEVRSFVAHAQKVAEFRSSSESALQTSSSVLPSNSVVTQAEFFDRSHGWMLLNDGSMLGTLDGGKNLMFLLPGDQPAQEKHSEKLMNSGPINGLLCRNMKVFSLSTSSVRHAVAAAYLYRYMSVAGNVEKTSCGRGRRSKES